MRIGGPTRSGSRGRVPRDPAEPIGESPTSDRGGDIFAEAASSSQPPLGPSTSQSTEEQLEQPTRHALRDFVKEHRSLIGLLVFAAVVTGFVIGVLPQITGLGSTLRRLGSGNATWLLVAVGLEIVSLTGYITLFRSVLSDQDVCIGWRASYEITLAGVVATKLFAAAGAGGLALTAWALRSAGLSGRAIAQRLAAFEIILYGVFMLTLVVVGVLLGTGTVGNGAPWSLSFLPAGFGAVVIVLALASRRIPPRLEQSARNVHAGPRWLGRLLARLAAVPATIRDGMTVTSGLFRALNVGVLGAVVYWGFDIATLWASFRAFGSAPPIPVVIMGYFVGQLANAIPLPGGIGGVEGGMIGCFAALHVNAGAALIAVFAYRAISFWLPTLPGVLAYVQLRRRVAAWRAAEGSDRAEAARAPAR